MLIPIPTVMCLYAYIVIFLAIMKLDLIIEHLIVGVEVGYGVGVG